ncbi:MAG: hypothetical protein OXI27_06225 [Thaumarchaeota archaeon]|nr:hypothetical protein [Nitrososphaerota archaeon]
MTFFSFKKTVSEFVWSKLGFFAVFMLALAGLGVFLEHVIVVVSYLWDGDRGWDMVSAIMEMYGGE